MFICLDCIEALRDFYGNEWKLKAYYVCNGCFHRSFELGIEMGERGRCHIRKQINLPWKLDFNLEKVSSVLMGNLGDNNSSKWLGSLICMGNQRSKVGELRSMLMEELRVNLIQMSR